MAKNLKNSGNKNKKYLMLIILLFLGLVLIYSILIFIDIGKVGITGFAVSDGKPLVCKGLFGNNVCDDSKEDCGSHYIEGSSRKECDECQTLKNGRAGFSGCVGDKISPISSPIRIDCEDINNPNNLPGYMEYVEGGVHKTDIKGYIRFTVSEGKEQTIILEDECEDEYYLYEYECREVIDKEGKTHIIPYTLSTDIDGKLRNSISCFWGCESGACIPNIEVYQ